MEGYWRHPGYVLHATLEHVDLVQRVQSEHKCAVECDKQHTQCNAFTFTAHDRICRLHNGAIAGLCSLADLGCQDPGVETYFRDWERM
jgi:hypothetical protein